MKDKQGIDLGFRSYQIMTKDGPVPCTEDHFMDAQRTYAVNTDRIYYRKPPPDTRSKLRKFIDEWKRRLLNAKYALQGHEFD